MPDISRFASIDELLEAHSILLERRRERPDGPLSDVQTFVNCAHKTGVILEAAQDRGAAQTRIDYWSTLLFRSGTALPTMLLADFDEKQLDLITECPYPGLRPLTAADYDEFFRRAKIVPEIVGRLESHRLITLVGPAGSGKTSLIRAALGPEVESAAISGRWWHVLSLTAGRDPVPDAAALEQRERRTLLVLDCFELVFTEVAPDGRAKLFATLARMVSDEKGSAVILAVREEALDRLAGTGPLAPLIPESILRLPAPSADDLRAMIEGPARKAGLRIEDGLPEALAREVFGEPGVLVLLQFALEQLWQRRRRNWIKWEAYRQIGSVKTCVAKVADETYYSLSEQGDLTKRIFLRLLRLSRFAEAAADRIRRSELQNLGKPQSVDSVLSSFADAALLRITPGASPGSGLVEVALRQLISTWPLLREWLDHEREVRRLKQRNRTLGTIAGLLVVVFASLAFAAIVKVREEQHVRKAFLDAIHAITTGDPATVPAGVLARARRADSSTRLFYYFAVDPSTVPNGREITRVTYRVEFLNPVVNPNLVLVATEKTGLGGSPFESLYEGSAIPHRIIALLEFSGGESPLFVNLKMPEQWPLPEP